VRTSIEEGNDFFRGGGENGRALCPVGLKKIRENKVDVPQEGHRGKGRKGKLKGHGEKKRERSRGDRCS